MTAVNWTEVRKWTQAALDLREVTEDFGSEITPLIVIERIHASVCEMDEHAVFHIEAGLLRSILARLLGREIRCANGCVNPRIPDSWDRETPVFCVDCHDAASRETEET